MIREHAWLLIAVAITILISAWVQRNYYTQAERAQPAQVAQPYSPDQFVQQLTWTAWDKQGNRHYRLIAERLEHKPEQTGTYLYNPRLTVDSATATKWTARAETAWLPDKQPTITLSKNVQVRINETTSTLLTTDQLTIDTQLNTADTDAPVRIESGISVLTSTGLHADLKTGKTRLLKQVRGKHETMDH
ncbi:MAG: LPS export ABC transporter periplasmic protein LptC [Gammaproteobacteria bacterium]